MLFYCCTNNTNRSRVSLRSTFSNWHVLFHYLRSFVHASLHYRHNYRTAIMQCRMCVSSTDFHTTNVIDINWTITLINQRPLHKCSWRHRILLRQRTIVDANHHVKWHKNFKQQKWPSTSLKVTRNGAIW